MSYLRVNTRLSELQFDFLCKYLRRCSTITTGALPHRVRAICRVRTHRRSAVEAPPQSNADAYVVASLLRIVPLHPNSVTGALRKMLLRACTAGAGRLSGKAEPGSPAWGRVGPVARRARTVGRVASAWPFSGVDRRADASFHPQQRRFLKLSAWRTRRRRHLRADTGQRPSAR